MNNLGQPRRKPFHFRAALLFIGLFILSGCSALVLPEGWAGITPDGEFVNGRYENTRYLYVAYRNNVFRIDLQRAGNGIELTEGQRATDRWIDWAAFGPNNAQMFAPPAVSPEGLVYVGSYNHSIYAFDPNSAVRTSNLTTWNAPATADKVVGGAVIHNGRIYVGQDKGIQAYDAQTGGVLASFLKSRFGTWSEPLIDADSNTLYFGSLDQNLYALDADSLNLLWSVYVDGAVAATPLLHEGLLYVPTLANQIVEIDTATQQITRRYQTESWVWSTPVIRDGTMYFGDLNGWVYALDVQSGQQIWRVRDEERPGGIRGSVAVVDDMVIAASENKYLRAYDRATGAIKWTSSPASEERIMSDVLVIGSDVVVTTLSENNLVQAYDLASGGRSWSVRKPNQDDINRITQTPPAR